jgi:hypothetical protein
VNDVIALNSAGPSDIVTSLPGSPIDGQVIYYNADSTNGVVWQLRYRSAASGSFKWEFVGGGPLTSSVYTREGSTSTNAYHNLTTNGPTLTVPLAGDYLITYAATAEIAVSGSNFAGIAIGFDATDPATYDFGVAFLSVDQIYTNGASQSQGRQDELKTGLSASTVVKIRYRQNQGTNYCFWSNRLLSLVPRRVG